MGDERGEVECNGWGEIRGHEGDRVRWTTSMVEEMGGNAV